MMSQGIAYFLVDAAEVAPFAMNRFYCGIDRNPWRCLDDAYYSGRITKREMQPVLAARKDIFCNLSFGALIDLKEILGLAELCGAGTGLSLLGVEGMGVVGALEPASSQPAGFRRLGIDLYVDGYGSSIKLGAFSRPDLFSKKMRMFNEFGLIDDEYNVNSYVLAYKEAERSGCVEPLSGSGAIWAYSVLDFSNLLTRVDGP